MQKLLLLALPFLFSQCASPIANIADRPLSPEEQKLVGTWAVTQELPHPQMGVQFPKSTVIQFHPDRTAKLVSETFNVWQGNYEDNRRWELVNGTLRETSGMTSISMRCTLLNDQTFRIDDARGSPSSGGGIRPVH